MSGLGCSNWYNTDSELCSSVCFGSKCIIASAAVHNPRLCVCTPVLIYYILTLLRQHTLTMPLLGSGTDSLVVGDWHGWQCHFGCWKLTQMTVPQGLLGTDSGDSATLALGDWRWWQCQWHMGLTLGTVPLGLTLAGMGNVRKNANLCGSEIDFQWRKTIVHGENKLVLQRGKKGERSTSFSFTLNTCETYGAQSHLAIAHLGHVIVNTVT